MQFFFWNKYISPVGSVLTLLASKVADFVKLWFVQVIPLVGYATINVFLQILREKVLGELDITYVGMNPFDLLT